MRKVDLVISACIERHAFSSFTVVGRKVNARTCFLKIVPYCKVCFCVVMPFISISDYTIFRALTKNIIWIDCALVFRRCYTNIVSNCCDTAVCLNIVINKDTILINRAAVICHFIVSSSSPISQSNGIIILQFGPFLSQIEVKCFVACYPIAIITICPISYNWILSLVLNQNSIDSFPFFNCF